MVETKGLGWSADGGDRRVGSLVLEVGFLRCERERERERERDYTFCPFSFFFFYK